ncbi:MAG TPA: ATP-binding protein [Solirubrobacterales bacterium]|nr:ATP-binding protein [Solirubrobacterales bacterium]
MASNQGTRIDAPVDGPDGRALPPREAVDLAERHIKQLSERHRVAPAEARELSVPRLRRLVRWAASRWQRLALRAEQLGHLATSPHHRLGSAVVHWRLGWRSLVTPPVVVAVLAALVLTAIQFDVFFAAGQTVHQIVGIGFATVLLGAVAAAWNDLVYCRWLAHRVRRRLIKRPESVLPTTATPGEAELIGRDERMLIVPREELADEVLPGIVDRRRKDVQVLVGAAGAGKTTALVSLSKLLARIGVVCVVVPVEGEMKDLVEVARKRFGAHVSRLIRSEARRARLWNWLRDHQRLVIAIDDADRIAPDGERGYLLRQALEALAGENLPTIVTTRPAGIPAGLAASAIRLEKLEEERAVQHVIEVVESEPGGLARQPETGSLAGKVEQWVAAGRFAEVPFYLELLARLVATGHCEDLAPPEVFAKERKSRGMVRRREDGRCEWNPLRIRFLLLERFFAQVANGNAYRWLAIEERERRNCLDALSEAALATLVARGLEVSSEDGPDAPKRLAIPEFLNPDDRSRFVEGGRRKAVSAHEVIDAGERLRILDRGPDGALHFRHRIMQSYLAARCLQKEGMAQAEDGADGMEPLDRIDALLDPRHPERISAHMTLTFTAMLDRKKDGELGEDLVERLIETAEDELPNDVEQAEAEREAEEDRARLDPRERFDPEARKDPDDALAKLSTAATIVRVNDLAHLMAPIVRGVRQAQGATMWTKLNAIPELAALEGCEGKWKCMWEFARDPDQEVRRAAGAQISEDALAAYEALEQEIDVLLTRAARRSAHGLPLDQPSHLGGPEGDGGIIGLRQEGWAAGAKGSIEDYELRDWNQTRDVLPLRALGWVLPAIVSGLREYPQGTDEADEDDRAKTDAARKRAERVRAARESLLQLVTLAFQGRHAELEAAVAQGFRSDAIRHARMGSKSGPGLVMSNRRLVTDICLHDDNAHYWYARLVLHQALALYTVAGSDARIAFDIYGRLLHGRREPHPLARRAAVLARRAVGRYAAGGDGWEPLIWEDEGVAVSRRPTGMNPGAAQLVGDVTLLLNLYERAPEDRQAQFPQMRQLPHCLHGSRNRLELIGGGCPSGCSYGLCPLRMTSPDEPSGQRSVSRGFCRMQQRIARHHKPSWDRRISRRRLRQFWREMEQRART